jgi:hypothetical protein
MVACRRGCRIAWLWRFDAQGVSARHCVLDKTALRCGRGLRHLTQVLCTGGVAPSTQARSHSPHRLQTNKGPRPFAVQELGERHKFQALELQKQAMGLGVWTAFAANFIADAGVTDTRKSACGSLPANWQSSSGSVTHDQATGEHCGRAVEERAETTASSCGLKPIVLRRFHQAATEAAMPSEQLSWEARCPASIARGTGIGG